MMLSKRRIALAATIVALAALSAVDSASAHGMFQSPVVMNVGAAAAGVAAPTSTRIATTRPDRLMITPPTRAWNRMCCRSGRAQLRPT
jgi:hypothetical protein